MKRKWKITALLLALCLLAGCGTTGSQPEEYELKDEMISVDTDAYIDRTEPLEAVYVEEEAVILASAPAAVSTLLLPEASGKAVKKNDKATIDYSNTTDGYVMAKFTATTDKRLKVQVTGPTTTYTYDLPAGEWATFPLSDGNGSYKATVLENTSGKKYAVVVSASFELTLKDEFAPFLRPNQYVDYAGAENTIKKAEELTKDITDPLIKVEKVYDFVVKNLTYDKAKADSVQSGYLPVLDNVLAEKKGICFDYASLMAGMLRSQGVPCKLVVGYAGKVYHAWISVWTEETGWVDGVIFFDGKVWQRMDPTFASSGNGSESIMKYIGDGSNYAAKYSY